MGEGRKRTYEIARAWQVVDGRIREQVEIREDGQELSELGTRDQKESFLRELVPPGVADLFFFDGERLTALAESENDALLADTVKSLLGLVLVEQLQRDLDIYLARSRSNHGQASAHQQLDELLGEMSELERQRDTLRLDRQANAREIARQAAGDCGTRAQDRGAGQWVCRAPGIHPAGTPSARDRDGACSAGRPKSWPMGCCPLRSQRGCAVLWRSACSGKRSMSSASPPKRCWTSRWAR